MRPLCLSEKAVLAMVAVVIVLLVGSVAAWAQAGQKPAGTEASSPSTDANAKQPSEEPPAPAEGAKRKWFRGDFSAGIDAAWSDIASDVDFNQYLRFKVDPPQCDKLHIRGAIWLNEDLGLDVPRYSALRDINDGFDSHLRVRPLYLYAELDDVWGDSTLRVGRQRILEGAAFNRVDGVYFKQRLGHWDWYVFAGARATVYDDPFQDFVTGGGASVRLFERTRVALDVYYGQEHRDRGDRVEPSLADQLLGRTFPRFVDANTDDTSVALSVWQIVNANLTLFGRYDWHNANGDEIYLNATGFIPAWDLTYEVSYRRQLNTLSDRVNDLTGFYRVLGDYKTHDNYFAAVHKTLTDHLTVSLEGEIHRANGSDWMTGNQDYERVALILAAEKIWRNIDVQAGVERWSADGGEGTWAVTGEVTKHWKKVNLTLGADYQRYEDRVVQYTSTPYALDQVRVLLVPGQYQAYNPLVQLFDTYALELHQDIHSFYLKTKWLFAQDQDVTAGVTYEEDDSPESPYWRVKAQYSIRF